MKTTFTKKQITRLTELGFKARYPNPKDKKSVELILTVNSPLLKNVGILTDGEFIGVFCEERENNKIVVISTQDYSHINLIKTIAYLSGTSIPTSY